MKTREMFVKTEATTETHPARVFVLSNPKPLISLKAPSLNLPSMFLRSCSPQAPGRIDMQFVRGNAVAMYVTHPPLHVI